MVVQMAVGMVFSLALHVGEVLDVELVDPKARSWVVRKGFLLARKLVKMKVLSRVDTMVLMKVIERVLRSAAQLARQKAGQMVASTEYC
jgi:hypothetical protein